MRFATLALTGFAALAVCPETAAARDGCGRGLAWNGYACVPDSYYQPRAPQPTPPPGYGGDLRPGQPQSTGGRRPGTVLGHGEAVGCVSSFSRVVEPGGGTRCVELP
jgi:hypothetical protein